MTARTLWIIPTAPSTPNSAPRGLSNVSLEPGNLMSVCTESEREGDESELGAATAAPSHRWLPNICNVARETEEPDC